MFTFSSRNANPLARSDEVLENHTNLINFCLEHDCKLMNTYFDKSDEQLVTYREPGITIADIITRPSHEQLDFVIA